MEKFKLPKKIYPKDFLKFELDLMRESLKRRGIKFEDTKEDIMDKLHEVNFKENLVLSKRPPLPCDYLDVPNPWKPSKRKWIGHGFFYKSGHGSTTMDKDNAFEDFDSPDNFCKLTKCKVLLADYDAIRKDFELGNDIKNEEIDEWFIDQFCYLSTGQIQRMKNGDLNKLVEEDWVQCVDESQTKVGFRQRGGGRANTFFVNDEYEWDENGRIKAVMIDCKGGGVIEIQPKFPLSATGFLSLADAMKGFIYERGMRKALKTVNSTWSTVRNYAIVDIGVRWKGYNPATGINGDIRNVVLFRESHSRYSGSADEPVYYSVVQMPTLEKHKQGKRLIEDLRKLNISSEQIPLSVKPITWNVQCTASFNSLVDFSHWYFLPGKSGPASILPSFRMSENIVETALRMWGRILFEVEGDSQPGSMMLAYGTTDKSKAKEIFESVEEELKKKTEGLGSTGKKPKYSWSWLCELDDSKAQKLSLDLSTGGDKKISMKLIDDLLK